MIAAQRAGRRWRPVRYALPVWLMLAAAASDAATPARIASVNLCTDSMLLELAPAATLSVTRLAQDPALTPLAARTRHLATNRGLAEELVAFAPDLILSSASTSEATAALMTRLGYRVEYFSTAGSIPAFEQEFMRLATLLDRVPEAQRMLARMTARLQALADRRREQRVETALLILANGYVPGPETLADDLLTYAGFHNAAAALGLPQGGFLTLEQLLRHPPQWLIIGTADPGAPALAGEYLRHPALRKAVPDAGHLIALPEALWACGGTYFADAVALLTDATLRARDGSPR